MSRPERLDEATIGDLLASAPKWERRDESLFRSFRFADFATAFGFMTQLAITADRLNHHPEWFNVYNRVEITMTTHDAGGLSALDAEFVGIADALAAKLGAQ